MFGPHGMRPNHIGWRSDGGQFGTFFVQNSAGGSTGQEYVPKDQWEKDRLMCKQLEHNTAIMPFQIASTNGSLAAYELGHHTTG